MKWKRIVTISVILLAILCVLDIIAGIFFYNLAIDRNVKDFLQDNPDLEVSDDTMDTLLHGQWRDWTRDQDFERMEITSYDGLTLEGYFLAQDEPTNKTVIMAHGYLGNALQMGLYGQYYYEKKGYNIFMADARGHGNSEGDYIGFGWHDRLDYVKWIDVLKEKLGPDSEFLLHGVSMGAATMLMVSGEDLPDNVKALVSDSAYTSVWDLFAYQMKRMYHLPSFPILNTTSLVTEIRAGYGLKEASALKQVEKADIPILYIHGEADTFVPTDMSKTLYQHTSSPSRLVLFPGANHGESFVIDRERYTHILDQFTDKYFD